MSAFTDWFMSLFTSTPAVPLASRSIAGTPGYPFAVLVQGNDLILTNVIATAFGGDSDPQDNGETASGVNTKGNPNILGCSLPLAYGPTHGSPIPKLPWKTQVYVTDVATGKRIGPLQLIDDGPAAGTGHAIDLTVAAARLISASATANNFERRVNVQIVGGAKYVT